jgi:hypothetical protein
MRFAKSKRKGCELRKVHRLAVEVVCTNAKRRELVLYAWLNPDAKRNLFSNKSDKSEAGRP